MVSLEERDRLQREPSPIPHHHLGGIHRPTEAHRPIEGLTMQELLRTAAKNTGGSSGWAESEQPLATFESSIASRISSQAHGAREGACQPRAVHAQVNPFLPRQPPWAEPDYRERDRGPPRLWSEPSLPLHQRIAPQQGFSSLANLGPAASNLAFMIENSQRVQYFMEHGASQQEAQQAAHEEVARLSMLHANPSLALLEQLHHHSQRQPSWDALRPPSRPPYGGLPPEARWGPQGPAPRPQARAFDVYQPPPQMSDAAKGELIRSLHMLQEAQRLAAQASSNLQDSYDTSLHGASRKRKLAEASNALSQQIGEVLAEGDDYDRKTPPQSQQCSLCGATSTPVWRRLNKALVCNACGLKRRRSAKVAAAPKAKPEDAQAAEATSAYPPTRAAYPPSTAAYPPATAAYPTATSAYPSSTVGQSPDEAPPPATAAYPSMTTAYPPGEAAQPMQMVMKEGTLPLEPPEPLGGLP